jgi:hypothetical protein
MLSTPSVGLLTEARALLANGSRHVVVLFSVLT